MTKFEKQAIYGLLILFGVLECILLFQMYLPLRALIGIIIFNISLVVIIVNVYF